MERRDMSIDPNYTHSIMPGIYIAHPVILPRSSHQDRLSLPLTHHPTSSASLQVLNLPIDCRPVRQTAAPLPKDPHRDRQQADEDVQAADDAEHLERALLRDPGGDEVVHAEGVDVTQVQAGEGLGRFVTVAFGYVAVDAARRC